MNKNNVKFLERISFSQITLAEKFEIENSGHVMPDLAISYLSSSRIQTNMRNVNPAIYAI
jgi:hypothetical protein